MEMLYKHIISSSPCGSWSSHTFPPATLHRKASLRTAFRTCRRPATTSRTQAHTCPSRPPWPGGFLERCSLESPQPQRTGPSRGTQSKNVTKEKTFHTLKHKSVKWTFRRKSTQIEGNLKKAHLILNPELNIKAVQTNYEKWLSGIRTKSSTVVEKKEMLAFECCFSGSCFYFFHHSCLMVFQVVFPQAPL